MPIARTTDGVRVLAGVPCAALPAARPLELHLHLPTGPGPAPIVVFLHGGGWRLGSRHPAGPQITGAPFEQLAQAGIAVAGLDHRLSGEARRPAQRHDATVAVRWLRSRADELGIDPDRIAAWGESTGGHLAALRGRTDPRPDGEVGVTGPASTVCAVVAWHPPTHLATVPAGPTDAATRDALLLGAAPADRAGPHHHVPDPAPDRRPAVKIIGFRRDGGPVQVGALTGDGVTTVAGLEEFWAAAAEHLTAEPTGARHALTDVELVPPVLPGARVLCIGLNYLRHVAEGSFSGQPLPEHPTLFARWTQSLSVGGVGVPVPVDEDGLDWEGEVVAYVGAELVDATPEDALAAVVGYSTFNDITARRAQKLTSQWILGKNADRSGPLGPIVPAAEVGDLRDGLRVQTRVNGQTVQDGSTDEMVYPVGDTLALVSRTLTLRPGDLLATGTPSGVGYARDPQWLLHPGDVVEVEVERLGTLTTPVVADR